MPTTTIIVYTSAASAVRTCCAAGWHPLELDLTSWCPAERDWLARQICDTPRGPKLQYTERAYSAGTPIPRPGYVMTESTAEQYRAQIYTFSLDVAPPTADRLHAIAADAVLAIEAAAQQRAAKVAADVAYLQSEIQRAREAPIAALVLGGRLISLQGWCDRYATPEAAEALGVDVHSPVAASVDRLAEATAEIARQEAATAAEEEARRATEAAVRAREAAVVRALVEAHDPAALPRLDADVLPDTEIHAALVAFASPAMDGTPSADVLDEYDGGHLAHPDRWIWTTVSTYTAAEYSALQRIERALDDLVLPDGSHPIVKSITIERSISGWLADPDHPHADKDGEIRQPHEHTWSRVFARVEIAGTVIHLDRLLPPIDT